MDYTLFRKELIYRERKSLEEFVEEHEENTYFIDNMLDSYYFSSADGKERALRCFNTAYYLCTLILMSDKHPEWNIGRYCDIAYCGDKGNKVYQSFTLSLVYIFLTHAYYEVPCKKLLKKLDEFFDKPSNALVLNDMCLKDYTYRDVYNDLLNNTPENLLIGEEFTPRKIDRDIFRDVDGPGDVWSELTNFYESLEVRKIVESLGKDEDEKHILVELISRDAKRFYAANEGYYHETVKPMLDDMDGLIYHEYNDEYNQVIAEAKIEELKYQGDVRPLQARIAELLEEVGQLKEKLSGFEYATCHKSETGNIYVKPEQPQVEIKLQPEKLNTDKNSLNQQLIDAQKTIEEQAETIQEQSTEIERLQTLNEVIDKQLKRFQDEEASSEDLDEEHKLVIDERIIFVSALLGVSLKPEVVNQKQLAKLIEKMTGDTWQSIRPRISSINSETQQVIEKTRKQFTEGTQSAAKNVYELIDKAVKGATRDNKGYQCRQAMENINQTYKLGIKM